MVLQPFYQGSIWSTTLSVQTLIAHCPFIKGMVQYTVCSPNPQTLSVQNSKSCQSKPPNPVSPTLSRPFPPRCPFSLRSLVGSALQLILLPRMSWCLWKTLQLTLLPRVGWLLVKNTSTHPFTKGGLAAGEPWCLFQFTLLPRGIDKFQRINSPSSSWPFYQGHGLQDCLTRTSISLERPELPHGMRGAAKLVVSLRLGAPANLSSCSPWGPGSHHQRWPQCGGSNTTGPSLPTHLSPSQRWWSWSLT